MAFILYVVNVVCVLSLFCGSANAVCNPSGCETYFKNMDESESASLDHNCGLLMDGVKCIHNLKKSCPSNVWDAVYERFLKFGMDLNSDIKKDCCDQLIKAESTCSVDAPISEKNFKPSDKNCKALETTWSCSRPYFKHVELKCKVKAFTDEGVKKGDKVLIGHLDSCKSSGYNITVDYNNRATGMQGHPLTTLVAVTSTLFLGLRRFHLI